MNRYVIGKVRCAPDGHWNDPMIPSLTVDDAKRVDTGLTDDKGNPIYRLQEPIGFGRR